METRSETLAGTAEEPNIDAPEWEYIMGDIRTLIREAEGKMAHAAMGIDDLMEITGSAQADRKAFMAGNQEWIRGLVDRLSLVQGRL